MTWDPSTDNIAVWSYDINVTGAIDTTFVFNPTNPTTNMVTFTNVANGVYNCSIVAVDNFGNKSLPSPIGAITVNYIAVSGIVISGGTTITSAGGTLALIATVTPGNATDDTVTWSVNNKTVATINAKTGLLTAVANGNVNVTATANDGSGVKASATITVSGQVSVPTLSAADLNLFPNPVIDVLHLSNTASINKIEICNANGQVVLMLRNSNEQMNINTSGLTNGIYFIRAYTNNNVITKQFVK